MFIIQFLNWIADIFAGTSFTVNFDTGFLGYIRPVISFIGYVIPLDAVFGIFAITMGLMGVRLAISLVKVLWELLPIV